MHVDVVVYVESYVVTVIFIIVVNDTNSPYS